MIILNKTKLFACAIVLITNDIEKTVEFYKEELGFEVVKHYEQEEKFAACYRDEGEIVVVKAKKGNIVPNNERYGAGYDAYFVPEDVDLFYQELKNKDVKIIQRPVLTAYGSKEFKIEDIDSRIIGIGKIQDYDKFFKRNS